MDVDIIEVEMEMTSEEQHREFLLQALRGAMLRCKVMHADLETTVLALKGGLIGADTAVAWMRADNLAWLVGPIPEEIGRVAKSTQALEQADADPA